MTMINKELIRINEILVKNQNKNIKFYAKFTKFGINKYNERKYNSYLLPQDIFIKFIEDKQSNNINKIIKMRDNNILQEINNAIVDLWLKYNNNNCRYTTFITLYYFKFSNFIDLLNGKEFSDLKELNSLILKLFDNYN